MTRILVADNDTQVNELLSSLLRVEGWEVEAVFDGEAAIEALRARPAALLVCDLDMPRMDGFALVEAVAELEGPQPAVLVVTGFTDPVVREQLAARGPVRDVWLKPFDLDAFCAEVRAILEPPVDGPDPAHVGGDAVVDLPTVGADVIGSGGDAAGSAGLGVDPDPVQEPNGDIEQGPSPRSDGLEPGGGAS